VIDEILPRDVATAWLPGDAVPSALPPEEEAVLGSALEQRRRDFALGRQCARAAIAALGRAAGPLLSTASRAPSWPDGLVGSITHCAHYCAAAVADADAYWNVGIDAETDAPLPPGVDAMVLDDAERAWIARAPAGPSWDRLVFSAKETVFKTWHPLTGAWLGFHDAAVTVDAAAGQFVAALRPGLPVPVPPRLARLRGRFLIRAGVIATAIALSR
jgi:4'-phosphopantetheinyl transferase EntD